MRSGSRLLTLATSRWYSLFSPARYFAGQQNSNSQEPVKDRFPPKALDPNNPKRKLAVLVDAQKVDADIYCNIIEPAVSEVGVPVLVRVFEHELSPEWRKLIASGRVKGGPGGVGASMRGLDGVAIEWFRVERFIPVAMQIVADANHIFEYKHFNQIDGVCYVCTELDRAHYELMLERLRGRGFNQYILDELGLVVEVNCDGRSKDGTTRS